MRISQLDQAMETLRDEFQCKNVGFHCDDEESERFYRTEYSQNRLVYLIYRTTMFVYQVGWFLAYYIYGGINRWWRVRFSFLFLTQWGNALNVVYFTLSFILAFIGYRNGPNRIQQHRNCRITFRSIVWLLHSVGQTGAVIITVVYWISWALLAAPGALDDPFNIHYHAINTVLYLIEIFVVAFPMRLLHFIYPVIFGFAYLVATLIYHMTGITSAVYPILNWNNPGIVVACAVSLIFLCGIVHFIMYLLHMLRRWLKKNYFSTQPQRESNYNPTSP